MNHIITVYDSLNYGSFFQARALQWELDKYAETVFIDIRHQNILQQTIRSSLGKAVRRKFSAFALEWKKYRAFKKAQRVFKTIPLKRISKSEGDCFFFGSDEIWNISRKKISRSHEFFGMGLPEAIRIAVAPSVNRAEINDFRNRPELVTELKKFYAVSVRDYHTKKVMEELLDRECLLVGDPTLMMEAEDYRKYQVRIKSEPYILIYSYGMMFRPGVEEKIRKFAETHRLKIISVGFWFSFCDKCIIPTPEEFLGWIDQAEYVITETFHGLMFSLIFEKNIAIFPCGNIKVEELLGIFDLTDRLCGPNDSLEEILQKGPEYNLLTPKIKAHGERLRLFILKSLQSVGVV